MEVLGKAPRAAKQRGDYLIIERRRQEKIWSDNEIQKSYFETTLLKSKFELDTDRKIANNKLDDYVNTCVRQTEDELNARRERLRELLAGEKQRYTDELLSKQETIEQREEKMKATVEHLKSQRERKQKAFVSHKLQQQWHNNCDDLRGAHSCVAMREALAVRNKQMEELKEKAEAMKEEKIRDAHLWEQDRQRKIAREEADNLDRIQRNKELVDCLSVQMEYLKKNRENQENLKKEKAKLVKEYMLNQANEEVKNKQRKDAHQMQRRMELDEITRENRERMIKEREEELKADVEMLQVVLAAMPTTENKAFAKERLRKESMLYQQYVREMAGWRRQQEKELNEIQAQETDKAFKAKLAAADKQAAARQALMKDVLKIRQEQIEAKMRANEQEMELSRKEAEEMHKEIEVTKRQEAEEKKRIHLKKQKYKMELDGQKAFARQEANMDRKLLEFEYVQAKKNEEAYQRTLQSELARMLGNDP